MWDFFDQIKCINLNTRDDKMIESSKVFKKLKIPVEYYRVDKHPTDGARGCYESHLSIIREAYYRGCKNVLIFEDDVIDSPYFEEKIISKAIDFMENNRDWDIFYFGHMPDIFSSSSTSISSNIIKTQSTLTHAYVVSRKYMKQLIDKEYSGIPIDKIYVRNENSYALYPMVFYQSESESDIATSSPIRGLRFSEFYAYHINYSITYLLLFIFLFLFIFLYFLVFR